jgi:hypothetical protein
MVTRQDRVGEPFDRLLEEKGRVCPSALDASLGQVPLGRGRR